MDEASQVIRIVSAEPTNSDEEWLVVFDNGESTISVFAPFPGNDECDNADLTWRDSESFEVMSDKLSQSMSVLWYKWLYQRIAG